MPQGDHQTSGPNRRRFLKAAVGTAGVGLLAGCTGGDGGEPETVIRTVEGEERTVIQTVEVTPEEEPEDVLPDTVALGAASPVFPVFYFPYFPIMAERMQEKYGVTMEAVSYGSAVGMTGGFMQGEIQLGYLSPVEATRRINQGLPIVSPTTQVHQYYHALSVDAENIDEWEDLRGKDVAVHSPLSSASVLTEALVNKNLGSPDEVNYQNIIGTTNRMAALEAGEVDAAIAFLSGAIQTEEQGYGRILDSPYNYDDLTDFPVNLWFAPEPKINENEEMYRILVQEMQASYAQIYEEDTEDLVERALATDVNYPAFPEEVWHRAYEMASENSMWPADYATNMSEDRLEMSIRAHIDLGLISDDERLPASELLDTRYVGEID